MKTPTKIQKSEQKNRPEQLSTSQRQDLTKHCANRALNMQSVLDFLKAQLPQQYEEAEIVGKWVWLELSVKSNSTVAKTLWRLGFHYNSRRRAFQHPCGAVNPFASHPKDPRTKYGSYFATDIHA